MQGNKRRVGNIKNYCKEISEEQVTDFIASINEGFYVCFDEGSLNVQKVKFEDEERFCFMVDFTDHGKARKIMLTDLDAVMFEVPNYISDLHLSPNWRKFIGLLFPEYEDEFNEFYQDNKEQFQDELGINV